MTMTKALPTFRYVRVRYLNGGSQRSNGYTYRCPFHVTKGDAPGRAGHPRPEQQGDLVLGSCAVEDNGFPNAKWVNGFWVGNGKGSEQPWPKNFNVRDADGRLLTHNQTRVEPSDRGSPIQPGDFVEAVLSFDGGGHVNCRSVMLANGYGGGTEVQLAAAEGDVKRLKKRLKREKRQAEFDALTAELNKRPERQKVRDKYRAILADETLPQDVRDEVEHQLERLVVLHDKLKK